MTDDIGIAGEPPTVNITEAPKPKSNVELSVIDNENPIIKRDAVLMGIVPFTVSLGIDAEDWNNVTYQNFILETIRIRITKYLENG